jgi:integrator complex subunit 11
MNATSIQLTPLGAGQDVGRSCILVSLGGKNIMFDCGMHMVTFTSLILDWC